MQVRLSKQNSMLASHRPNLSGVSFLLGIIFFCVVSGIMVAFPGKWSSVTGLLILGFAFRYFLNTTNRRPLLLEITDNQIIYLSEERNEHVTVNSEDISAIDHKFCELRIHTKDHNVHLVNLLNTGSEQTRWEIKEHIKKLTENINE